MRKKLELSGFSLINDAEASKIKGGSKLCNWAADIHSCVSFESKCTGTVTITDCTKAGDVVNTCTGTNTIKEV